MNGSTVRQRWSDCVPLNKAGLETSVPDELLLALRGEREVYYAGCVWEGYRVARLAAVLNDLRARGEMRWRVFEGATGPVLEVSWPVAADGHGREREP